jgi:hypothetical protein
MAAHGCWWLLKAAEGFCWWLLVASAGGWWWFLLVAAGGCSWWLLMVADDLTGRSMSKSRRRGALIWQQPTP